MYWIWLLLFAYAQSLVLASFSKGPMQETGRFLATIMVFIDVEILPWSYYLKEVWFCFFLNEFWWVLFYCGPLYANYLLYVAEQQPDVDLDS